MFETLIASNNNSCSSHNYRPSLSFNTNGNSSSIDHRRHSTMHESSSTTHEYIEYQEEEECPICLETRIPFTAVNFKNCICHTKAICEGCLIQHRIQEGLSDVPCPLCRVNFRYIEIKELVRKNFLNKF